MFPPTYVLQNEERKVNEQPTIIFHFNYLNKKRHRGLSFRPGKVVLEER